MNVKIRVKGKKHEHNRFGINWCKSKARYTRVGKAKIKKGRIFETILVCPVISTLKKEKKSWRSFRRSWNFGCYDSKKKRPISE